MRLILLIVLMSFLVSCNSCNSGGETRVVTIADVGGNPDGVAVADSGNIYITDIASGEIKQIDETGTVTTITDLGDTHPDGIAAVTSGTTDILYVANANSGYTDGTIIKIEVASDNSATTTTFLDNAEIVNPAGIAADSSGNLYVADQGTGDVYKVTVTEGIATSTDSLTDGSGITIDEPHGLTLVTNENNSITLYTTDQGSSSNNIIQIDISETGTVTAVTELTNDNSGGTDTGTVDNAKFNEPHGISTDKNGAIFVCDENNNRIQIITPSGNVVTFAGSGTSGDSDGEADNAQFNKPRGLATDSNDNLLVCDYGNGKVKKIIK